MQNSVLNNLKSYSATQGKRKQVLSCLSSQQTAIRSALIELILHPHRQAQTTKVEIVSFRPIERDLPEGTAYTVHRLHSDPNKFQSFKDILSNSKSPILLILGVELLSFSDNPSKANEVIYKF